MEYSVGNIPKIINGGKSENDRFLCDRRMSLVIDIQDIIAKNKGAGFERWAKKYNLKQTAKALCFIQERGIKSLSKLTQFRFRWEREKKNRENVARV